MYIQKTPGRKRGKKRQGSCLEKFGLPGIPGVRDYYESEESGYMVTEYLTGQTMRTYCEKECQDVADKGRVFMAFSFGGTGTDSCSGLIAGNLSPDTLVVTEEGNLAAPGAPALEGEGSRYLAPEQREKEGVTGP